MIHVHQGGHVVIASVPELTKQVLLVRLICKSLLVTACWGKLATRLGVRLKSGVQGLASGERSSRLAKYWANPNLSLAIKSDSGNR